VTVTDKFAGTDVTGYIEGDFSGNDAPNVYQTVNGHTNRLRLYFGDLKRGKWEFLGGQTWSLLTPNRNGLNPIPSDLAITLEARCALPAGSGAAASFLSLCRSMSSYERQTVNPSSDGIMAVRNGLRPRHSVVSITLWGSSD
jgi:hypothetical protein